VFLSIPLRHLQSFSGEACLNDTIATVLIPPCYYHHYLELPTGTSPITIRLPCANLRRSQSIRLYHLTSLPSHGGHTPRLSLYGSHIGGLLATTVALTGPTAIHSLAVLEPLVDWVSLDENQDEDNTKSSTTRRKTKASTPRSLHDPARLLSIRSKLFRTPETYFDAFASPILFLRAPGRDCPSENPDPSLNSSPAAQAFGSYDDGFQANFPTTSYQALRRRKVLRHWPPNTTAPTLPPHTRVYVRDTIGGEAGVLRAQGEELVEMMRRACFYGREKEVGEARVQLQKMVDIPGSEVEGIVGVKEAAMWLAEKFEEH
jgi:hypothetical protein